MRRLRVAIMVSSVLVLGLPSPAALAEPGIVVGLWPQTYAQFLEIGAAASVPLPYFRSRQRDGQFDSVLVGPDATQAAEAGFSLGLNIQPKTGSGQNRTGVRYTAITSQLRSESGPHYEKLVSFANEVLALPTYGEVTHYLQFHSEANYQAPPGELDSQPYSGTSAEYRECYELVRQLFDSMGVTDRIEWQIVLTRRAYEGDDGGPLSWFPSDPSRYDLVGVDSYHRPPSWLTPAESFDSAIAFAESVDKPVWIDETGSDEGGAQGTVTAKAAWFTALGAYLDAHDDRIDGIVFSHAKDGGNWFLDSVITGARAGEPYSGTTWDGWRELAVVLTTPPPTHPLTVTAVQGSGGGSVTSQPSGIDCGATCVASFEEGEQVTLIAHPEPGSTVEWSGGCVPAGDLATCTTMVDGPTQVTATFVASASLTVSRQGDGSGSVSSSPEGIACGATCTATFPRGSSITLTATPDVGSTATWVQGCEVGADPRTCEVTLDAPTNAAVRFDPVVHDVVVGVAGSGSGTVTSSPSGIDCGQDCTEGFTHGTQVTLTPTPNATSTFAGWSGACSGLALCTVTVDRSVDVAATFTLRRHTLTVGTAGTGTGTIVSQPPGLSCPPTCSAAFDHGTSVALTPTPTNGATFTGWSGACGGGGSCSITMVADAGTTATFTAAPGQVTLPDASSAIAYDGWRGVVDGAASGGSYRISGVKNDAVTWVSPASRTVTWTARTGPNLGRATVTIDGSSKGTVDLYAPTPGTTTRTYTGLSNAAHTVVVKVAGAKSAASTGTSVTVDAFGAGAVVAQDTSPAVRFNGWRSTSDPNATDGTYRSTTVRNATATATFTGQRIDWVTTTGRAYGRASVTIDGVSRGTIDLYRSTTTWRATVSFSGLAAGSHTIVIKVLDTKSSAATATTVVVDGFVAHP